jgi:hypothetical protein
MADPKEKAQPSTDLQLANNLLEKAQDLHTHTGADVLLVVNPRDLESPAYAYASPKLMPMITQAQRLSTITQLLATKENASVPVVQLHGGPAVIDLNEELCNRTQNSLNATVQQAADPQFCSPVQSVYQLPADCNPVILTSPLSHSQVYPTPNPHYASPVIQSPLVNRHLIQVVHSSPLYHANNNNQVYNRHGQQHSSSPQWNISTDSTSNTSTNTIPLQSTKVLPGSLPSTPPFSLTSSPSSTGGSSSIGIEINLKFLHAFKSVHRLHLTPEEKTQVINLICANNQILLAAFEAFSSQSEEDLKYLTQAAKNLINNQCAL